MTGSPHKTVDYPQLGQGGQSDESLTGDLRASWMGLDMGIGESRSFGVVISPRRCGKRLNLSAEVKRRIIEITRQPGRTFIWLGSPSP